MRIAYYLKFLIILLFIFIITDFPAYSIEDEPNIENNRVTTEKLVCKISFDEFGILQLNF